MIPGGGPNVPADEKPEAREGFIERSWDANAAAWTQVVRARGIESRRVATDDAVLNAVLAQQPRSVLDAGCGEGWLAHRLAQENIAVTGFDASAGLIEAAREGPGRFSVLSYADFTSNPQRAGDGFDVVVWNFSLLAEDIVGPLAATTRVLRPGGCCIIQTLHPFNGVEPRYEDGWREETFQSMSADFRSPMPWYFRTIGSWVGELTRAGFVLQTVAEPIHPETGKPLSLLLIAGAK